MSIPLFLGILEIFKIEDMLSTKLQVMLDIYMFSELPYATNHID